MSELRMYCTVREYVAMSVPRLFVHHLWKDPLMDCLLLLCFLMMFGNSNISPIHDCILNLFGTHLCSSTFASLFI